MEGNSQICGTFLRNSLNARGSNALHNLEHGTGTEKRLER
jgi:hypothetical protein